MTILYALMSDGFVAADPDTGLTACAAPGSYYYHAALNRPSTQPHIAHELLAEEYRHTDARNPFTPLGRAVRQTDADRLALLQEIARTIA
jgi:hypothetical protein